MSRSRWRAGGATEASPVEIAPYLMAPSESGCVLPTIKQWSRTRLHCSNCCCPNPRASAMGSVHDSILAICNDRFPENLWQDLDCVDGHVRTRTRDVLELNGMRTRREGCALICSLKGMCRIFGKGVYDHTVTRDLHICPIRIALEV